MDINYQETYELVDKFEIDNEELNGLSNTTSFVLGVEWEMFRNRLASEFGKFSATINSANAIRLKNLCSRHGRKAEVTWKFGDTIAEGWCRITVHSALKLVGDGKI